MASPGTINRQMAAAYSVRIEGVKRTKADLQRLDNAIRRLRTTDYSSKSSTTVAAQLGGRDLLVTQLDDLEGNIQGATIKAMDIAMKRGKEYQTFILANATTPTGRAGIGRNPAGRNGPGRDDTGAMIDAIKTNVESMRIGGVTLVTGWHGWSIEGREGYFKLQEKGTKRIAAANSLGGAIPPTREDLKRELGKLKR